jgi:uncharacterized OB-fold protein
MTKYFEYFRSWRCANSGARPGQANGQAMFCRHPTEVHCWACLESMNWVRVTGAGHVYLSHIGGCAPDRVI